jgi:hypothetical protein
MMLNCRQFRLGGLDTTSREKPPRGKLICRVAGELRIGRKSKSKRKSEHEHEKEKREKRKSGLSFEF